MGQWIAVAVHNLGTIKSPIGLDNRKNTFKTLAK